MYFIRQSINNTLYWLKYGGDERRPKSCSWKFPWQETEHISLTYINFKSTTQIVYTTSGNKGNGSRRKLLGCNCHSSNQIETVWNLSRITLSQQSVPSHHLFPSAFSSFTPPVQAGFVVLYANISKHQKWHDTLKHVQIKLYQNVRVWNGLMHIHTQR